MTNPAMPIFTTDTNCIHSSLPPIQSPTTDPSPSGVDDEEVVVLDVVSPATITKNPCTPPVNVSTHAAAGKNTEVSNIITLFNPQASTAKKRRCNMLHGCFKVTVNASVGGTCTMFGVSNCFFWWRKYHSFWYHILTLCCSLIFLYFQTRKWKSFSATYARGHALQCPGVAIKVRTRLIQNSQAGRLTKKMAILTPPTNSTLGGQSLTSVR